MAPFFKKRRSWVEDAGDHSKSILRQCPTVDAVNTDVALISDSDDAPVTRKRGLPSRRTQRRSSNAVAAEILHMSDDEEAVVMRKRFTPRRTTPRSIKDFFPVKSSPPPADDYENLDDVAPARKRSTKHGKRKKLSREVDDEDDTNASTYLSPCHSKSHHRIKMPTREEDSEDDVINVDDDYTGPTTRRSARLRVSVQEEENLAKRLFDDLSADEEEPSKKRARVQVKYQTRITPKEYGYKKDDFVVSDAEISEEDFGNESGYSGGCDDDAQDIEEQEELEPIDSDILDALDGERPPFSSAMICFICRDSGAPPLGTGAKGWRDGYVQPSGNFSAAVLRGNYGLCRTEPFCLQHASRGQNDHVKYLQAETEANRDFVDTSESERDDEKPSSGNSLVASDSE